MYINNYGKNYIGTIKQKLLYNNWCVKLSRK